MGIPAAMITTVGMKDAVTLPVIDFARSRMDIDMVTVLGTREIFAVTGLATAIRPARLVRALLLGHTCKRLLGFGNEDYPILHS
jgi:hypothetical protein